MAAASDSSPPNHNATETIIGPFHDALHAKYILELGPRLSSPTSYEGAVSEHLRMSGVYWSLGALSILRSVEEVALSMGLRARSTAVVEEEGGGGDENTHSHAAVAIVDWVFDCYDPQSGGFGGNGTPTGGGMGHTTAVVCPHDGHLLYTLSALQILAIAEALDDDRLDKEAVVQFVACLQNSDGSFRGDRWGEVDTRFTYCAFSCLALLGRMPLPLWSCGGEDDSDKHAAVIDVCKAVRYVLLCRNFDGGFGCVPGAESHAGQVFCCIRALSIAHSLHLLNKWSTEGGGGLRCRFTRVVAGQTSV